MHPDSADELLPWAPRSGPLDLEETEAEVACGVPLVMEICEDSDLSVSGGPLLSECLEHGYPDLPPPGVRGEGMLDEAESARSRSDARDLALVEAE